MAIKVRNLSFTYPNGQVGLIDVNLDIEEGKKTAILGLNGSGKSTLLHHLAGITLPQRGRVEVLGREVCEKNLRAIRRELGFLFDYPDHQLFSTTVYQDIRFGLDNYRYPEVEKDERIRRISKALHIESLLELPPHQLSLGQKKKVAIAGLMVLEPSLLFCDEPFSGLDGYTSAYFKELLDALVAEGKTIVLSTHDVDLSYEWADRVIILKEGELLSSGPAREVLGEEEIYQKSNLTRPILYELFQDCDHRPRNMAQARAYIGGRAESFFKQGLK